MRCRRKLPVPLAPNIRIAQISTITKCFDFAEPFPRARWNDLADFRPRVLVGSASDLQRLYRECEGASAKLESLDYALFVLTQCGANPLSDVLRVSLWQAFGVPLYELFVGPGSILLAAECEAHEGWHIEHPASFSVADGKLTLDLPTRKRVPTGLTAEIEDSVCPCGRVGLRLMNIDAHAAWAVRQGVAASAATA